MTDLPPPGRGVPSRLGVRASVEDGRLLLTLITRPNVLHHGVVRTSVLSYLVDALAGVEVDVPATWSLTADLSVRARPMAAPPEIVARATNVRSGRRSSTSTVELATPDGELVGLGAATFTAIDRRPSDPPKPDTTPERTVARFETYTRLLAEPLRDEAGITSLDPSNGVVEVVARRELQNSNGTIQGAMVALIAEAAAEDLIEARFGVPVVVTDLDVRYLNRMEGGIARSSCRVVGDGPTATVEVRLHDADRDRITTLVYARAAVVG